MTRDKSELIAAIQRVLEELHAGRCSITGEDIASQPDEDARAILTALRSLHDRHRAVADELERLEREERAHQQEKRALVEARDLAQAASRTASQFLATMSHEIRTPLSGIISVSNLLLATALDDEQREYAETIKVSSDTVLALLGDILDYSKMESGKVVLAREPFALEPCITKVVRMAEPLARDKGLELSYSIAADVPPVILGDAIRLIQVLGNLVNNAVKFTARGSITVTVTRLGPADAPPGQPVDVEIAVADTGIGIAAAALDQLFERFTQADATTARDYGGTGLGLAICKELVELMNGKLDVRSHEGAGAGAGSTFAIRLPVVPASESEAATLATRQSGGPIGQPRERPGAAAATAPKTGDRALAILIAEDNPINRQVALRLLRQLGYAADVAVTGSEAIEAMQKRRYDIVFMDLHMPAMDGIAATEHIVRAWPAERRPVIIAMTARAMPGDRERCLAAGMNDYLSKPVTLDALGAALARWEGSPQNTGSGEGAARQESVAMPEPDAASAAAPGTSPAGDEPLVDADLGDQLGKELLVEMIEIFADDVPPRITRMQEQARQGLYDQIRLEAHSVRGAAANLGVMRLAALCGRLESAAIEHDARRVTSTLDSIARCYEDSKAALVELARHQPGDSIPAM